MSRLDLAFKMMGGAVACATIGLALWQPWFALLPFGLWIGWLQAGSI